MAHPFRADRLIPPAITLCTAFATLYSPASTAATLSISKLGSGTGSVASDFDDIVCGDTCQSSFPFGTMVQLEAKPDTGSTFLAWAGGPCAGQFNVCKFEVGDQDITIAAYFGGAAIAAGSDHAVALNSADTSVWAWGKNDLGQLGDRTLDTRLAPVPVQTLQGPLSGIIVISAGYSHTVALRTDGKPFAWGDNRKGQLGDNTTQQRAEPVEVDLSGAIAVSAGEEYSVALTGMGAVWSWGDNRKGQLGDGSVTPRKAPVPVPTLSEDVIAIATGKFHTVALKNDGTVWTWGGNNAGQLGNGAISDQPQSIPALVPKIKGVVAIDSGAAHTVALKDNGDIVTWGRGGDGQLGNGAFNDQKTPVSVYRIDRVLAISAGYAHTAALTADGSVWTWGLNRSGQLGIDPATTDKSAVPQKVPGLKNIIAVAAGAGQTVVLDKDGQLWAFGSNRNGELGDGTGRNSFVPVLVQNLNLFGEVIVTPTKYTVTATAGTGGTISPASRTVEKGKTTTFTVTPKAGYSISSVTGCNGSLPENSYTTNPASYTTGPIDAPCTVKATFKLVAVPKHTVTATAGAGGTITPATRTVEKGKTTTFTVKPNSTYLINTVTGCSGKLSGTTYTTGAITANCAVKATFKAKPPVQYTVTATAGSGGTISPAARLVTKGSTTTFTVTVNTGYVIDTVTGCNGTLSSTTYTTGTITAACTVNATFKVKPVTKYAVTLKTAGTGSGTVKGAGSFAAGTTVKLTATAASGSTFTSWSPSPCAASFTMPAKALTCTATFTKDEKPSDVPETVHITGGCFQMGSPTSEPGRWDDETQHEVCVDDFEMGKYEVTFDEYDAFADDTGRSKPSDEGWGRGKRPVINVDWNDAVAYTEWLSKKTGQSYRLPTEAEWEYAARAGTTTPFWTGQCVNTDQANYDGNYDYGSCPSTGVYRGETIEVGSFPANPWGLHDTMGNVWEWTCSLYNSSYGNGDETRCTTVGTSGDRSIRGGSWYDNPSRVRSANRLRFTTADRATDLGFRVVLPASRS